MTLLRGWRRADLSSVLGVTRRPRGVSEGMSGSGEQGGDTGWIRWPPVSRRAPVRERAISWETSSARWWRLSADAQSAIANNVGFGTLNETLVGSEHSQNCWKPN